MKAIYTKDNKSFQFRLVNILGIIFWVFVLMPDVIAQSPLCESYPTMFCCEYVSEVELNGVKRAGAPDATGFSSGPGYFDYTGSSLTTLTAGNTYPVSVTVKTNSSYQEFVKIWFDFNGNGVLNDPGELVFDQVNTFNGTYVYSGNITVPTNAFNGDVYIRVVMVFSNSPALCGTYGYGTTIDLMATITGGIESHALNVNIFGENGYTGGVVSSPSGIDTNSGLTSANFAESSIIQLTASPTGSANFVGWSGDISGSDNPISINISEDKNVVANFGPPNSSPVATDDNYTVNTGEILSGNLLENDFDADGDDIEITVQPTLAHGVFNSFNLETGAFEFLAPTNWTGTFSFNYTITDGQATSSGTATITVLDNIPPVAVTQNVTIYLDAGGQTSVAAEQVDNGSTDNIAIVSKTLSKTDFTCEDLGENTVTLTVADAKGNSDEATATVTVVDNIAPEAQGRPLTVSLDENGYAEISPSDMVDKNEATIVTYPYNMIAVLNRDIPDIEPNDLDGSFLSIDDSDPYKCYLNSSDSYWTYLYIDHDSYHPTPSTSDLFGQNPTSITFYNSSVDNCGEAELTFSKSTFSCNDVGENEITVTTTDESGNSSYKTVTITVVDQVNPVAATQDITIELDATGNASITAAQINNGSSDACGIASFALSQTGFDCSHVGANTVVLAVTDNNGNVSTATATVTVEDNIIPVISCIANQSRFTDAGVCTYTVTGNEFDPASFEDNCTGAAISNDYNGLATLNGAVFNKGTTTVTWTVTDESNNTATCSFDVVVTDNEIPVVAANGNSTVSCITDAVAPVVPDAVDNCDGNIAGVFVSVIDSPDPITCEGTRIYTYSFTDAAGNASYWTYTYTIEDNIAPEVVSTDSDIDPDIENFSDSETLTFPAGNNSCFAIKSIAKPVWTDNCGGTVIRTQSADNSVSLTNLGDIVLGSFPVGETTVTFTGTDCAGNSADYNLIIIVEDTQSPVISGCPPDQIVDAGPGLCSKTVYPVTPTASDNCAVTSVTYQATGATTFSGTEFPNQLTFNVGETMVTYTASDGYNESSCSYTITVIDNQVPVISANPDITQFVDAGECNAEINVLEPIVSDNCGIEMVTGTRNDNLPLTDPYPVGTTIITWNAVDIHGNDAVPVTQNVTVIDNIAPIVLAQNITVQLDANGVASIVPGDIDNGSTDNCAISTYELDITAFGCEDVGTNTVTLTVTDVNNNSASATAVVTVEDNVAPNVIAQNITVQLDENGEATIVPADIDNGSTDNCSIAAYELDITGFDCEDVGENTVTLTVTDVNDNSASATAVVTVEDNVVPTVATQNITVQLDENGTATIVPAQIDNGSTDNCAIASYELDITGFGCEDVGANTVTLTVTDVNNNSASAEATVTVEDNIAPEVDCRPLTIHLRNNGIYILSRSNMRTIAGVDGQNGNTSDNCTANDELEVSVSPRSFSCEQAGSNVNVTVVVTDLAGNSTTCETFVKVVDTTAPIVKCRDIEIFLDETGMAELLPEQLDAGSSDACGIEEMEISRNFFGCDDQGDQTVTLTVWDTAGNKATCNANVSVKDTLSPSFVPVSDVHVVVDRNISEITIDYPEIIANDNCMFIQEQVEGRGPDGIFPLGTTVETWVATDIAGNSTYLSFNVIVARDQDANRAPYVENPIDNQELYVSEILNLRVSPVLGEIFNDSDNEVLTISIYQEDTGTMPVWMHYESDTLTIKLTSGDVGCVNIVVQATDLEGLSARDTLQVCVKDIPVTIDDILAGQLDLLLYPNPTQGEVIIEITSSSIIGEVELAVLDINGRQVINKEFRQTEKIIFDMSDKVSGIYFVKLNIDGNQVIKKLIVNRN